MPFVPLLVYLRDIRVKAYELVTKLVPASPFFLLLALPGNVHASIRSGLKRFSTKTGV